MSLNIKTATGELLEIGGQVTKEKVISALGYLPANETHVEDVNVHVSSEDRQAWNNKSDFSGFYADLPDAPSITENESGEVVYADESGHIIAKITADGFETTTVTTKSAVINGVDITVKLDEYKEDIDGVNGDLSTHTSNTGIHVTADDKTLWNNKSDFSGDYADLTNAPSIIEDGSGELVYTDESGNVIAKINENGLETTQVIANTVLVNGDNVGTHIADTNIHITATERETWNSKVDATYVDTAVANLVNSAPEALNTLDELSAALGDDANFASTVTTQISSKASQESLNNHTSDKVIHITAEERTKWDNKSDFSGVYDDLINAPSITENESGSVVYTDENGNIIVRIDANGFETTVVTAKSMVVNGTDVENALDSLGELIGTQSVPTQISEAITAENLSQYATDTDLISHTSNTTNPHSVTKSQVGLGNVPNVATNDQTPTYSVASTLATLVSGEKLSVSMGKIMKAITDLISHLANTSNPHSVTKSQVGLGNVDNKSSATIRGELTKDNVITALGYTPPTTDTVYTHPTTAGSKHIPSGGSSGQILRWSADGTAEWGVDNNTEYSAGTGISLSGTTFSNSGVRSVASGSADGTISVNTNGTSADVAVKGLGTAAYTESSAYATAAQGTLASNAMPKGGGEFTGAVTYTTLSGGNITSSGSITASGTITGDKVYGAVYNDYAEFFPRGEETEAGDLIALDLYSKEEKYIKANRENFAVVGVHSNEFSHLIGGEIPPEGVDFVEYNLPKYIPVGLMGRCHVKVSGTIKKGDFIVPSDIAGVGCVYNSDINNISEIVGRAVENKDDDGIGLVKIVLGR